MTGCTDPNRQPSYKPSVFRRGLLVVLVPCVMGSAFLLFLNHLWLSSSRITEQEQSRSAELMSMSTCFNLLIGYVYDIVSCSFDDLPSVKASIETDKKAFYDSVKNLSIPSESAQHDHRPDQQRIGAFRDYAVSAAKDAEALAVSLAQERFTSNIARFIRYRKLMSKGSRLADAMDAAVTGEMVELAEGKKKIEEVEVRLRAIIALGLPFSLLAAIVAQFLFARAIVVKLKLLALDAGDLTLLSPPENAKRSLDEFEYLEVVFRQAAQDLRESAEKREAVMQMLAHDMRSPIMAAQINVDIVKQVNAENLSPEALTCCAAVKEDLSSVHEFVTNILTVEKLECEPLDLDRSEFSLASAVDAAFTAIEEAADDKDIVLENECDAVLLQADRDRIVQAILNLLAFSVKRAPAGSMVSLSSSTTGNDVTLRIADSGSAIDESRIECLFDPFRKEESGDSDVAARLGLNLRIARLIVEAHGGTIGGKSLPEGGRLFWFSLPISGTGRESSDSVKNSARNEPESSVIPSSVPLGRQGKKLGNIDSARATSARTAVSTRDLLSSSSFRHSMMILSCIFILQSVSLCWLNSRLNASQILAKHASTQTDTVIALDSLWLKLFRANNATASYLALGGASNSELALQNLNAADELIGSLDAVFQSRLKASDEWSKTRSFVLNVVSTLKGMREKTQEEQAALDLGELGKLIVEAGDLNKRMLDLVQSELSSLASLRREQANQRERFQSVISIAIACNFLTAVALLWIFSSSISSRLSQLVDFTKNISLRRPITEMFAGNDEIYQIYWLLCRASLNLKDALDHRKYIMQMVARDIGKPLSNVQLELDRLAEMLAHLHADKKISSLNSSRDNIKRVLALVDDLLVIDQLEAGMLTVEKSPCRLMEIIDS